jgi:hypothetical protein
MAAVIAVPAPSGTRISRAKCPDFNILAYPKGGPIS